MPGTPLTAVRALATRLALTAALALSLAMAPGCSTNPATGKRSFTLQSWEWERAVALEAGPQFTQEFGGAVPDETTQQYVSEVGIRLKDVALDQAYADVPELEWEFTFLDSSVINAFALPGGKVYISRGLAAKLENEAQMAGVLGHEVGHVMARHGNQRISKQLGFNLAIAGLAVAVGVSDDDSDFHQVGQYAVPALAIGGNVVLLKYGRDEELEADRLGMQYMAGAGYDPAGQRGVMQILMEAAKGPRPPEFLSTHPHPESRVEQIDTLLRSQYAGITSNPEYALNPKRYQQRMLDRLANLPPAQHPKPETTTGAIDLAQPTTWCLHCALSESRP